MRGSLFDDWLSSGTVHPTSYHNSYRYFATNQVLKSASVSASLGDMSLTRLARWYRNYFSYKPTKPPYKHVCQVGDPILRLRAEEVRPELIKSSEIAEVINKMKFVMDVNGSVGLAAPQIGIGSRIAIVQFPRKYLEKYPPDMIRSRDIQIFPQTVFINPEIQVLNPHKISFPESCESIKGFSGNVPRYYQIIVTALDESGNRTEHQLSGWISRIMQHEIDHLDGKLYIDRMDVSSFQNDWWQAINYRGGKLYQNFNK